MSAAIVISEPASSTARTAINVFAAPRIVELAQRLLRDQSYSQLLYLRCDYHAGVLTLRGAVSSYFLKQMAQTAVGGLRGVGAIINRIEVSFPHKFPLPD